MFWRRWLQQNAFFGALLLVLSLEIACQPGETVEENPFAEVEVYLAAAAAVQLLGAVTTAIAADSSCGLASPAVAETPALIGEIGREGTIKWELPEACEMSFAELTTIATDCLGQRLRVKGNASVDGQRVVSGILTGNAPDPLIPVSRDPVELELAADFAGFTVSRDGLGADFVVNNGRLSGTLRPQMALDSETGVCSIPTPVVTARDINFEDATLRVLVETGEIEIRIASSALAAQVGTKGDDSNSIAGEIDIGGEITTLPTPFIHELDPEFDEAAFRASFDCDPRLEIPATDDECEFTSALGPDVAHGIARLTPLLAGVVGGLLDQEATCGFSSPDVIAGVVVADEGAAGFSATYEISSPCTVALDELTTVMTDCFGVETAVGGSVIATATRTVYGVPTGVPAQPVMPVNRDAVIITLNLELADFTLYRSGGAPRLTVSSGALSGELRPRLAIDTSIGACVLSTPVVTFSELTFTDATVELLHDGVTMVVDVASSDLHGQMGTKDTVSNTLAGKIDVNGHPYDVPADADDPGLDPDFDPYLFELGYSCQPNLEIPRTDADCSEWLDL